MLSDALLLHFVFFYVFCIGSGLHYKQICYFFVEVLVSCVLFGKEGEKFYLFIFCLFLHSDAWVF